MKIKTEIWECRFCDVRVPCIVQIKYTDDKLPEKLKGQSRFRNKSCVCEETRTPDWKRVDII